MARIIAGERGGVVAYVASREGLEWVKRVEPLARAPVELGDFDGSAEKTVVLYRDNPPSRVVLAGAGDSSWYGWAEALRVGVASAVRAARKLKGVNEVTLVVEPGLLERAARDGWGETWAFEQAMVAGDMAAYVYTLKSREKPAAVEKLFFPDAPGEAARSAEAVAEAVRVARDVANGPPSRMNPEGVEKQARLVAERFGLGFRVLRRGELESLGMGGILGVGAGSNVEPRLIVLEYNGGGKRLALVGKTVTFDSGGLDLKPPQYMLEMKYDKAGGAAVLGAVAAAAALKLPVSIVALLPAVENMPSGSSYKPLDVLEMYNGLRVEVGNTDAEGRLIMADALAYAVDKYKPDAVVDLATLTGAAVIALGNHAAALMGNNEQLLREVEEAAWRAGEPAWRLPTWPVYRKQLESKVADTNNVGGRPAGAITAAKFLEQFVGETPWAHLDIAGVAWVEEKGPWKPYYETGATGWGVRTIVELVRAWTRRG